MQPTSEERREVAENLRYLISRYIKYKEQFFDELAEVVVGFEDFHDFDAVLEKLADLIDPTCHMTDSRWDNGECTWGCICSACGAHIEHTRGSWLDYCPHCGARLVSE